MSDAQSEARRALNRLRRALEKGVRELEVLSAALRGVEGADFPSEAYAEAEAGITRTMDFVDEESRRLREKILQAGGLEPGRVRRSSTLDR